MDEETKFIHNLTRLAGLTKAVTVDFMLDTLLYINKNSDRKIIDKVKDFLKEIP